MILIIGIGNTLRQDDGAGWALADRLADALDGLNCPSRVVHVQQLAPENALIVSAADISTVCFADVAVDSSGLQILALDDGESSAEHTQITHQIGPRTVLAYASSLRRGAPHAWLFTVGGVEFGHGENLSGVVQASLADTDGILAAASRISAKDAGSKRGE